MKLIIQNHRITATATDDYAGPDEHITAPEDFDVALISEYAYVDGVLVLDAPAPQEVPRYCGLLAIKRHRMVDGQLQELGEADDWQEGSLYAQVLAYRAGMAAGAARDRLDVALNDVLSWARTSPTVADLCAVLQLSDAQRDALFVWAKSQEAAI